MSLINRKLQKKDSLHVRCQKCLEDGHWSYQCKNNRKTKLRPSRTQILKNFVKQMEQTKTQSSGKGKLTIKKQDKKFSNGSSSSDSSDSSSDSSDSSDTSDSEDSSDSSDSSDFSDSSDSDDRNTKSNMKKLKSSVKAKSSDAQKRCSGGQCSLPSKKKRKETSSESSDSYSSS